MRLRLPLSVKIVAWFFLNLLLLGLGFAFLFSANIGFDSVLSTVAKAPVRAVADLVAQELNSQPVKSWDNVLKRFDGAYGMEFGLYFNEGKQIAGTSMKLPQSVLDRMPSPGPHPDKVGEPDPRDDDRSPPRRPPPPGAPGGERDFGDLLDPPPPGTPPPLPPGERPPFDPRPRGPGISDSLIFIMSTAHPIAYWAGAGIPLFDPVDGRAMPVTLVMRGNSLSGGLFFDSKPWLIAGFGAVFLSVLFWIPLVRGVTQSLRKVTDATTKVAEGDFNVRVPDQRSDELGILGHSVNVMAQKLDGFVHGQKRFLGDIAHELCSPIARMQVAMGILEHETKDPANARNVERMGRELRQISDLVNELLSFSKASLKRDIELQPVRLAPLARRVIEREANGVTDIRMNIPDDIAVLAEPELLARAIGNVVRNALRYAGESGPVDLNAQASGEDVTLKIRDNGPGVPDADLPKLLDAFYRPDAARNRDTGGVGLGLAIVKSCVEACHGTVSVGHAQPRGLEITMKLVNAL